MHPLVFDRPPPFAVSVARALLPGRASFDPRSGLPPVPTEFRGLSVATDELVAYRRVTGLPNHGGVPLPFVYVLAQRLQFAQMARRAFPFSPAGLVHAENMLERIDEMDPALPFDLESRVGGESWIRSGLRFSLTVEVRQGDAVVARCVSTYVRRMDRPEHVDVSARDRDDESRLAGTSGARTIRLDLPEGLGRHYAAVSGDYNPIHLSVLTARLFGFRRPIAHGMYVAARAAAEAHGRLRRLDVAFRSPVPLPSSLVLTVGGGEPTPFEVRSAGGELLVEGTFATQ